MKSIEIKAIRTNKSIPPPIYQSDGAVGLDLYANVQEEGGIHSTGSGVK